MNGLSLAERDRQRTYRPVAKVPSHRVEPWSWKQICPSGKCQVPYVPAGAGATVAPNKTTPSAVAADSPSGAAETATPLAELAQARSAARITRTASWPRRPASAWPASKTSAKRPSKSSSKAVAKTGSSNPSSIFAGASI